MVIENGTSIRVNRRVRFVPLLRIIELHHNNFYLFLFLFIQYFKRVSLLAKLASLPSGPL